MRRRSVLQTIAGGVAGLPLATACGAPDALGIPAPKSKRPAAPDALVFAPARQLALTLGDLPVGFRLAEELAPTYANSGMDDPYGRLSAYSATYAAAEKEQGDVVSSINAYASVGHAETAFQSWQAAVPRQYRPIDLGGSLKGVSHVAFARDGACLVGVRVRNVLASVLVQHGKQADHAGGAPAEAAAALVQRVLQRIERAA